MIKVARRSNTPPKCSKNRKIPAKLLTAATRLCCVRPMHMLFLLCLLGHEALRGREGVESLWKTRGGHLVHPLCEHVFCRRDQDVRLAAAPNQATGTAPTEGQGGECGA